MNEKKPTNPWTKSLFIWMGILLALVLFVQSVGGSRAAPGKTMPYSDFVKQVDEGNVKSISVAATPNGNSTITGILTDEKTFRTVAPKDANVSERVIGKGGSVQVKAEESASIWQYLLLQSLPFILMIGIAFFIMRQMQKSSGGGAMGFGKSRAKMLTEKSGKVTFADVAGIDEAREELQEIVEFLRDPGKFARLGGKIPKGEQGLAGTG